MNLPNFYFLGNVKRKAAVFEPLSPKHKPNENDDEELNELKELMLLPENTDQSEEDQHKTGWEESAGGDEATANVPVVEEEEGFSGDLGIPGRDENSVEAEQSGDEDAQPPATTEQKGSETSED